MTLTNMDDYFLIAKDVVNEIFENTENFKTSIDVKRILENKLNLYQTYEAKLKFLNTLEKEGQIQFQKVNDPTKKVASLPQYMPYYNLQIQIKNHRNDICITNNLSFLMIENKNFVTYLSSLKQKLQVTSAFIEKENFINSEIKRICDEFVTPLDIKIGPGWRVVSSMNYSEYRKYGYHWLISGNDLSIENIVLSAKQNYKVSGGIISDETEFNNGIIDNLRDGVAFVQYEKFLHNELKNIYSNKQLSIIATNLHVGENYGHLIQTGHSSNLHQKITIHKGQKLISKKSWLVSFFSNPWIITVIGGLLIAFLAKLFGWV